MNDNQNLEPNNDELEPKQDDLNPQDGAGNEEPDTGNGNEGEGSSSNEALERLRERLSSQGKRNNKLEKENQSLKAKLEKLQKDKGIKGKADEDKTQQALDEKDKRIAELEAQASRTQALNDTNDILHEAGVTVPREVLEMVVTTDDDQTFDNVKALLGFIDQVREDVRTEVLKGSTPKRSGNTANTKPLSKMSITELAQLRKDDPEAFSVAIKRSQF